MGEYELAECIVHGEAVDRSILHRQDQLGGSAIHCETARDEFGAGQEDLLLDALRVLGEAEDTEDGSDADASVEVAAAVNGVADDGVSRPGAFVENDAFVLLFRDEETAFPTRAHGSDEEVVADDVEFLLVIPGCIGGAGKTGEVDEGGAADVVGYGFEGKLESVTEEGEVAGGFRVFRLLFGEEAGEGDDVGIYFLLGDGSGFTVCGGCHSRGLGCEA